MLYLKISARLVSILLMLYSFLSMATQLMASRYCTEMWVYLGFQGFYLPRIFPAPGPPFLLIGCAYLAEHTVKVSADPGELVHTLLRDAHLHVPLIGLVHCI